MTDPFSWPQRVRTWIIDPLALSNHNSVYLNVILPLYGWRQHIPLVYQHTVKTQYSEDFNLIITHHDSLQLYTLLCPPHDAYSTALFFKNLISYFNDIWWRVQARKIFKCSFLSEHVFSHEKANIHDYSP